MRRRHVLTAGLALATTLPGCALLGIDSAPLDTFVLTPPSSPAEGRRRRYRQILIAEPTALKTLDGQNIVIMPQAGSIQFLDGAQWADRLPKIVQSALAQTYQETGRIGAVGLPGEGLAIDFQITTDIRAFEIRNTAGGSSAHVALHMRVLNDRNGVVRSSRLFSASYPVTAAGNAGFVQALDRAFDEVATDIVTWTLQNIG